MDMPAKKKLPIGVSSFAAIRRSNGYYVDKTQLIMRLIDSTPRTSAILFTRPRRFGKTLNLDMLNCFFDCNAKEKNRPLFDGLEVSKSPRHMEEQGIYPVIFISFKDTKSASPAAMEKDLRNALLNAYGRFDYLLQSDKLSNLDKKRLDQLLDPRANLDDFSSSLSLLCSTLAKHHGQPVVLLIDEYDVPMQMAYQHNNYGPIRDFMRNFLSAGLKDNHNLRLAVITGVLRIAKDSLFSGLNNLIVDTILSKNYDDCFGFTQTDVEAMLEYYGKSEKLAELKDWYDGYRFGESDIYNPWSVLQYMRQDCCADAYWLDTSSNDLSIEFLQRLEEKDRDKVWDLYRGGSVTAPIDTSVSYQQLDSCDPDVLFSLMAVTGYLKPIRELGRSRYQLQVPNAEINTIFADEILRYLKQGKHVTGLQEIWDALRDDE